MSHDPSEIILFLFFIIINVEISCATSYFCGNSNTFLGFFQSLFEKEIFCNIVNVFTVTFGQFNATLRNRSIRFLFQKQKNAEPESLSFSAERFKKYLIMRFQNKPEQYSTWNLVSKVQNLEKPWNLLSCRASPQTCDGCCCSAWQQSCLEWTAVSGKGRKGLVISSLTKV